jgi:adhesin transport system membrane fusion protein
MLKQISNKMMENKIFVEDQDFISDINDKTLNTIPLGSHIILWLTFAFVSIALVWANFATLDEVTRGTGRIIPSSQIQVIQNLEGGILAEIMIREGDLVEKGQALLRLDDVRFSSSFNETQIKYYELLANIARLTAEANQEPLQIPKEVTENFPELSKNAQLLYDSEISKLNSSMQILQHQVSQKKQELIELKAKRNRISRSYSLLNQELKMSEPLVAEGAMSEVEILRLRRSVNDVYGEMSSARLAIPRIQAAIDEAVQKIEEQKLDFHTKALVDLNKNKAELDRSSETILALKDRVNRTLVTSPVKGIIKRLKVNTVGGVIQPGMDLLEIVPLEDQLLIEAQIRPADIAFLHPGQKAIVKLTAYDFSIYGGLQAKLEHISADSLINEDNDQSYFLIRLRTEKNYLEKNGAKLNIIAGMTTDIDILTGKKSVLDYILKPILKAKENALKER